MNEEEQQRIARVPVRSGSGPLILGKIIFCNNKVFTPI